MNDNANSIDKKENIFYSVTKKLPKYNIIFKKIFIRFILCTRQKKTTH